ncbi:hypothetical protein GHT09_013859 [Marmota monax]|uniref:Uncharacterized protein n=1 Tax=Marmota monax TaxID=9995 RepID=A0A834UWU6_MARMO|nr:hypothetical protein GHT09_013859 [Marmota monax]
MLFDVNHDAEAGLEAVDPGCWGNCPINAQRERKGGLPESRERFFLSDSPLYPSSQEFSAPGTQNIKMVSLRPGLKARVTTRLGVRCPGELGRAAESWPCPLALRGELLSVAESPLEGGPVPCSLGLEGRLRSLVSPLLPTGGPTHSSQFGGNRATNAPSFFQWSSSGGCCRFPNLQAPPAF